MEQNNMADFDDIVERRGDGGGNREPSPNPNPTPPSQPDITLIDLLNDEKSLGGFANQLNPDLKSKVLLLFANLQNVPQGKPSIDYHHNFLLKILYMTLEDRDCLLFFRVLNTCLVMLWLQEIRV